jgi:alpha-aminoadipic semialdehyde synthase
MFSHTVKGQPYNMPLLSRFLGPKDSARLIDYELLTEDGVRSVGFGWFAGGKLYIRQNPWNDFDS